MKIEIEIADISSSKIKNTERYGIVGKRLETIAKKSVSADITLTR